MAAAVKPPKGIKPRRVHDIERLTALSETIYRYLAAGLEISVEWVEEYNELVSRYGDCLDEES